MEEKSSGGDVIVVGGGAVGCAIARSLSRRGLSVVLLERERPGAGATWAAAGMLAPLGEAAAPGAFLDLGLESLGLYPDFVAEVEGESGMEVGYVRSGKLQIAFTEGEVDALRLRHEWLSRWSPDVEWIAGDEIPRVEPGVSAEAAAALLIPGDHQVDSRRLGSALWEAAAHAGVSRRAGSGAGVKEIESEGDRVSGVVLEGGERIHAASVVIAAGCWSGRIRGLPRPLPVRPVRGQMLSLHSSNFIPRRMIATSDVYLVPRDGGTVLVGATVEEAGFRSATTSEGQLALRAAAVRAAPPLASARGLESWAGLRPGTPDDLPIIGKDPELGGLFYATGHYRNGILLTPVTARIITEMVLGGPASTLRNPFRADRFTG